MILLASSTDKVSVITSAASSIDVHVSFANNISGTITSGRQNTVITTAATTDVLAAPGSGVRRAQLINIRNKHASASCAVTVQYDANATLNELFTVALQPGDILTYTEKGGWTVYAVNQPSLFKVLTADDAGGLAANTVQPWFPTNGAVAVLASKTYLMEGMLKVTSGATSHSMGLGIGGTATLTSVDYYAQAHRSAVETIISVFSGINIISAANTTIDVAGVQVGHYVQTRGVLRINAAGTIIPQFTFSANPTGTITVKRNSYFRLTEIGDNTVATAGTWS